MFALFPSKSTVVPLKRYFLFFNYQITKETTVPVKKMFKIKHEMHEKNAEKVNIACFVKVWNNILNILLNVLQNIQFY